MQEVRRKYGCLRAIGIVILLLAWVILFLGLAGAVLSWLSTPRMFSGIQLAMLQVGTGISLVIALTLFFQWFVLGSVLTLMTDLEHNTRRNAEAVSRLVALAEAPEKAVASLPVVAAVAPVAPVPPPPPPLTPTLEANTAATTAAVAAGSAVAAAGAASLAEGPLPPPPPMAPSIVAEVEAAAAGTAAGVQDVAAGAGDAVVVAGDAVVVAGDVVVDEVADAVESGDVAGAVDAVASQVEPIEPVG